MDWFRQIVAAEAFLSPLDKLLFTARGQNNHLNLAGFMIQVR